MNKKFISISVAILIFIALLVWLFVESSKPLPGQAALQDGRDHLAEGSKVNYKFNPPTSGNHYASWISKGFYDTPRSDGNLVHSLEHGYIVIWYDCGSKGIGFRVQGIVGKAYAAELTATPSVKATDANVQMTAGSEGSPSALLGDMPKSFSDGSCDNLKTQLKDIYNKFGPRKLIIVPRVGMDRNQSISGVL